RTSMPLRARITALLAIFTLLGISLYGVDKPITVGLVFDGLTPAERAPLQAYLTKAMERPVILAAPDLYRETVAHLADGSYDFACLGALMYIRSRAKYGVIPLVRRSSDLQYHTVFITRADSSIYSLRDLMGKQFALGDINTASAQLIPYRELKQAGIDPKTDLKIRYSGSHGATAALVESGVVVARKDVPEAEREKFARALLALKEGKDDPILKVLRAKRFVVATDQEYATMRQIIKELEKFYAAAR